MENFKRDAAYAAVDNHVQDNQKIGIGSGSTVEYVVMRLAERIKESNLKVLCVPTSFQSRQLLIKFNIPHTDLLGCNKLDIAIDGADEVDSALTLIKGGGGCQLQEKLVASVADKLIIVADEGKKSSSLGQKWKKGVPLEVIPLAQHLVTEKITQKLGHLTTAIVLRMAKAKAGPVVTDNGNIILDWQFKTDCVIDWQKTDDILQCIPGIVETGIFHKMAQIAYFGTAEGVQTIET